MLHQNKLDNSTFYEEYSQVAQGISEQGTKLLKTIEDSEFPGAIISAENNYYIGANSQKDWSVLTSLVKSFLGVSFSDFIGIKHDIDTISKEGKYLLKQNIPFISLVSIPSDQEAQLKAERAFLKLYEVYQFSPNKSMQVSEYIDSVLENFISALQVNDINTAQQIILQIKKDNRLDALNIKFMQIELAHSTSNWHAIVNDTLITHIINSRKPLKIRLHIIEAFYYEYLSDLVDDEKIMSEYKKNIRPTISSLLFNCPANASDSVKAIFLLGYINDDIDKKEIDKIATSIKGVKSLSQELIQSLQKKLEIDTPISSTRKIVADDYVSARASIIDANNTDTIESIATAKAKLEHLEEQEQSNLVQEDLKTQKNTIPLNWIEWLNFLSNESFTDARQIAEQALEEWPIDELLKDTTDIKIISNAIQSIEEEYAVQRFIHALPLMLASCRRSEYFPNPMFLQMYTSILEVITVHEIKDLNTLVVSQDIVETLLKISPNEDQYRYILGMIDNIVDNTNGKNFINWLLDYAELLISENASNIETRDKLLQKILNKIYSYRDWIEEFHLKLILQLAASIGMQSLFTSITFEQAIDTENPWEKYTNKTIGIYTLSENAARHAKEYIEEQVPNVKIILNHDKAATDALRNLANTSDYVVLVTQSAKHAATGEIQKILRKKDMDPLFPIGKGSSSIISALLESA